MEELNRIIRDLKAPKNQKNNFGGYMYRSAEDILEAVKPLLGTANVSISDEIINVGNRYYVRATVTYTNGEYCKILYVLGASTYSLLFNDGKIHDVCDSSRIQKLKKGFSFANILIQQRVTGYKAAPQSITS